MFGMEKWVRRERRSLTSTLDYEESDGKLDELGHATNGGKCISSNGAKLLILDPWGLPTPPTRGPLILVPWGLVMICPKYI